MLLQNLRGRILGIVCLAVLALAVSVGAHVVPNMTIEADFSDEGGYTLRISIDPRTFLATDPTTLPPVPASWYREQTPEQITATQRKACEYLDSAVGLVFGGRKSKLPACEIQAIDGSDNTPLTAATQEVHLLATAKGQVPGGAADFQLDFAKEANTTLILQASRAGVPDPRPQVVFPGEISRPFPLVAKAPPAGIPLRTHSIHPTLARASLILTVAITLLLLITGWHLLNKHRHYHRGHRKPQQGKDVNN